MMATFPETETTASRVLYINSKDATAIFNNNRADFDFVLEEPIVVPDHHSILMSVYSAEIPYSFYNFQDGRNTLLQYVITPYGQPCNYDANGVVDMTAGVPGNTALTYTLPQGNYNAVELANIITASVAWINVTFDPISLKFRWECALPGNRVTLALRNGPNTGTPDNPGDDMNEELGFDWFNMVGDPYFGLDAAGTPWEAGYSNGNPGVAGPGIDIPDPNSPSATQLLLDSDDVVDMTNSIRSLFIRTNLSTSSVLDSHIGGGFSNILCRVPINAEPGGIITIEPKNGTRHQLLLKLKNITSISLRLTNQTNTTINLNGLDFDISLKLDFIESKFLKEPPTLRQLIDEDNKVVEETGAGSVVDPLDQPAPIGGDEEGGPPPVPQLGGRTTAPRTKKKKNKEGRKKTK